LAGVAGGAVNGGAEERGDHGSLELFVYLFSASLGGGVMGGIFRLVCNTAVVNESLCGAEVAAVTVPAFQAA
jgi:hypothetical protein